jgi:hypothetical protein
MLPHGSFHLARTVLTDTQLAMTIVSGSKNTSQSVKRRMKPGGNMRESLSSGTTPSIID